MLVINIVVVIKKQYWPEPAKLLSGILGICQGDFGDNIRLWLPRKT